MTNPVPPDWSARGAVILGMLTIATMLAGFGGWSYFATIDSAIIAFGQVEVDQNKQIVQHPEGGVVAEIAVKEAQTVQAGDLLIRLDGTAARSELELIEAQLSQALARRDRLQAELADRPAPTFSASLMQRAAINPAVAEQISRQSSLFAARKQSRLRQSAALERRRGQISLQIQGIVAQSAATTQQLSYINQDLDVKAGLQSQGLVQSAQVLALQREAARLRGDLGALAAAEAAASERATEAELDALRAQDARQEAISTELQQLNPQILTLSERQDSLTRQIAKLDIRAPVSGVVLGLQVTARQAVLRAAEPLLYIVPQDRALVVSVKLSPLHRNKAHVGQQVRLVFPAFSAGAMPPVFGHLTGLSADVLIDPHSQTGFYRAEIEIADDQSTKLTATPLLPGMPVEAFIKTGQHSPISYLLKPVTDYFDMAMREN